MGAIVGLILGLGMQLIDPPSCRVAPEAGFTGSPTAPADAPMMVPPRPNPDTGVAMTMDIRFLGHAAFELSDGDTSVLIDPFLTGNPKAAVAADDLSPQAILLTHGHVDHIGDTVADRQAQPDRRWWRSWRSPTS